MIDKRERVLDPMTAYQITSMMEGVVQRGTATVVKEVGKPIAGKTGTTNDEKDAWFIGFSPDLVVGVYLGYDKPRHLGGGATGGAAGDILGMDPMKVAAPAAPIRQRQERTPQGHHPRIANAGVYVSGSPRTSTTQEIASDRPSRPSLVISRRASTSSPSPAACTHSGIPYFRGPDGVWTRARPACRRPGGGSAGPDRPDPSHLALFESQRLGKLRSSSPRTPITSIVASGIRPELLAELHGNGQLMRCLGCDRQYPRQEVGWDRDRWGPGYRTQGPVAGQPSCPDCGGRLISSVVNFGDPCRRGSWRAGRHARAAI